jgi:Undecaprenyl-phosphate galactose phosphotransferase WbaP
MDIQSSMQEIISLPIETGETINSHLLRRQVRWIMVLALVLSDLIGLLFAMIFAIGLRTILLGDFNIEPYYRIIPLLLIFPLFYVLQSLYPAIGIGPVDELRRLTISTSLGFITFIIVLYLMYIPQVFSRTIFILSWALALGVIPLARLLTRNILIKIGCWGEPVAVFGPPELNQAAIAHLINNPSIGMRPVLNLVPENNELDKELESKGELQKSLISICKDKNIKCAILTDKTQSLWGGTRLDLIEDNFERVVWVDIASEQQFLWVKFMELGGMAGIEKKHELAKPGARAQKQLFDLIGSLLLMLFLSPIFLIISLVVKLTSKGSVLYKQTRIGKDGQSFKMLKFRTMYEDADQKLDEYLTSNSMFQDEWDSYQKLKDDPRITPVGRILRLYSIDELPQLWNVFNGDMSLVGPRPFMPEQKDLHADTFHHYIRLRPGLTGMWQVYGRNDVSYEFRVLMDEYYFRNWSIWLDIFILIRTPWVVIRRLGAY